MVLSPLASCQGAAMFLVVQYFVKLLYYPVYPRDQSGGCTAPLMITSQQ